MSRTVAIGLQDFAKIITEDYFYIDKTNFIKEWWESGDAVTLITRPRRFGKTLNLNMLDYFFSNKHPNRGDLFEGLAIWENEKYRNLQGTYPVISFTFANIKETSFEKTKKKIYQVIIDIYEKNSFILEGNRLKETEEAFFRSVNIDMDETVATQAVHKMCDYLYHYYGKKVIVLLDEYDTPMQEAYVNGFWDELVSFTRSMFNATFKTNPYLERGIMTGITRVSKESIFSDLNNLKVITTTSNEYATSFGFTEEEVFGALDKCNLGTEKEGIKQWYNGFVMGNHKDIYNPWSVLNFLDVGNFQTYWANSSSNSLVDKLIREGNKNIKLTFEELLRGNSIRYAIDEQIVYNQLDKNPYAIWSLLLASGYLKVLSMERAEQFTDGRRPEYELTLTNYEVRLMFQEMVSKWFYESDADYNEFINCLLCDDLDGMNICMNRLSLNLFSYFDTGNRPSGIEPERFYHGFVLGLLVDLRQEYILTSNRESGFGRYDILIEPKNPDKYAYIIEFKVLNPRREKALEDTLASALQQIEDKQYETVLIEKGIPMERIRKYGFAFKGKEVLIG